VPAPEVSPTSGVFHAITVGAIALKIGFVGILAAILVTVGNAGGVGSTVAGIARVPFRRGDLTAICRRPSGKFIRAGRRRMFRSLWQAVVSGAILLLSPGERNDARRVSRLGRRRNHSVFHSVPLYVRGGDSSLPAARTGWKIRTRC